MFNTPGPAMPIDKRRLQQLLDEIVTPRLQKMGLAKHDNYSWYNKSDTKKKYLPGSVMQFHWNI